MEKSNVILPASTKLAKGIDGLDEVARRSENLGKHLRDIRLLRTTFDRRFAIKKKRRTDLKPTLSSIKN